jgi:hypothetical protein
MRSPDLEVFNASRLDWSLPRRWNSRVGGCRRTENFLDDLEVCAVVVQLRCHGVAETVPPDPRCDASLRCNRTDVIDEGGCHADRDAHRA